MGKSLDRPIAYYVTSHGYGHLNRAAAVVESLPRRVPVLVRAHADLHASWRQATRRPVALFEASFDCGAVHPRGDSSTVDPSATLEKYARVHAAALRRVDDEIRFLRANRVAAVVSDIASLPLDIARAAGVPGILVANFTWADIYAPYVRNGSAAHRSLLSTMRSEYAAAALWIRAQPAMAWRRVPAILDVGLVTRRGRKRRGELRAELGIPGDRPLAYVYTGRYGQQDVDWGKLAALRGIAMVSYHEPPIELPHWYAVDPVRWPPRDLAASVQVMVAKAGYGTVSDAMAHGVPLVYPPRFGFSEHRVLDRGLRRWGGGVSVGTRAFRSWSLGSAIRHALRLRPAPPPWPIDGARRAARAICRLAGL